MIPNPNPSPELREDNACAFVDCPPGLFRWQDIICFKSEYSSKAGQQDAYCVSSGEYFWGGTSGDLSARRALIVMPLVAALSPQTLPAPGEVERDEMFVRDLRKMRAAGGALAVAAVQVIHEYDGLHRLSLAVAEWQKVIASEGDRDIRHTSPTLATVAAANDEAFARGVEAAAKVAENLCADMTVEANEESVGLTSTLHRASAQTAGKIAAAIRLLSQGEGK